MSVIRHGLGAMRLASSTTISLAVVRRWHSVGGRLIRQSLLLPYR